ncbi:MAG: aldehyde-activating protein [Hyphomicrobiales bacterium]|nr:MAG: aldehyde-activating protein [Hyphomicrobiales bacterium]
MSDPISGGCQCGAVRFRVAELGNPSICHCRMCQKAFGGFYGPLVTATGLEWTRGAPKIFNSSNKVKRGFCGDCGTPLTYDWGGDKEVAIGALDDPTIATPTVQVNRNDKLAFVDTLHALPFREHEEHSTEDAFMKTIISYQHPDHDTTDWKPKVNRDE